MYLFIIIHNNSHNTYINGKIHKNDDFKTHLKIGAIIIQIMTNYRPVTRTSKRGSIKRHNDIDWIFYATVQVNQVSYSCTKRTLDEAEEWIENIYKQHWVPRAKKSSKR